ncbi:MAG TPA: 50S ribosomal protein L5 [bacterium]|nr:50S ribosomal protein L5 [bacterium]HOL49386.1 50S ribosomal protein L5 [bacterium]HPO51407.1 50S ribosomal protein L5 [bacterium]HXK44956.1 50S ribosomal protein L5 [bacterium]
MEARLKILYREKVVPSMMEKFGFKNSHQVPCIQKVVINVGVGKDNKDAKAIESVQKELALISGQKPVITRGKKSISSFNLRKGDICGVMVTLRGQRMYEFLDRMITAALPRVKDFNGLNPDSFDDRGSYTLGIREQVIFPEVDYNTIYKVRGMNITICTNAKKVEHARELLKLMGLPLRED